MLAHIAFQSVTGSSGQYVLTIILAPEPRKSTWLYGWTDVSNKCMVAPSLVCELSTVAGNPSCADWSDSVELMTTPLCWTASWSGQVRSGHCRLPVVQGAASNKICCWSGWRQSVSCSVTVSVHSLCILSWMLEMQWFNHCLWSSV